MELGSTDTRLTFLGGTMQTEADRFKELYDVEKHVMAVDGGVLVEDPYPALAELRAESPVHRGSVRELLGFGPGGLNLRPEAPVYSALSFEANDIALRQNEVFSSTFYAGLTTHDVRPQHSRDGRRRAPPPPGARAAGVLAEAVAVVDRPVDRLDRRRSGVGLRDPGARGAECRALRAHPVVDDHVELRPHTRGGARLPRRRRRRDGAGCRRRSWSATSGRRPCCGASSRRAARIRRTT